MSTDTNDAPAAATAAESAEQVAYQAMFSEVSQETPWWDYAGIITGRPDRDSANGTLQDNRLQPSAAQLPRILLEGLSVSTNTGLQAALTVAGVAVDIHQRIIRTNIFGNRGLGSEVFADRERAHAFLGRQGAAAVPALIEALGSNDAEIRCRALSLLEGPRERPLEGALRRYFNQMSTDQIAAMLSKPRLMQILTRDLPAVQRPNQEQLPGTLTSLRNILRRHALPVLAERINPAPWQAGTLEQPFSFDIPPAQELQTARAWGQALDRLAQPAMRQQIDQRLRELRQIANIDSQTDGLHGLSKEQLGQLQRQLDILENLSQHRATARIWAAYCTCNIGRDNNQDRSVEIITELAAAVRLHPAIVTNPSFLNTVNDTGLYRNGQLNERFARAVTGAGGNLQQLQQQFRALDRDREPQRQPQRGDGRAPRQ